MSNTTPINAQQLEYIFDRLTGDDQSHIIALNDLMQHFLLALQSHGFSSKLFLEHLQEVNKAIFDGKQGFVAELTQTLQQSPKQSVPVNELSLLHSVNLNEVKTTAYITYINLYSDAIKVFMTGHCQDVELWLSQYYAQYKMTLLDAFNAELQFGNRLGETYEAEELQDLSIDFIHNAEDKVLAENWITYIVKLVGRAEEIKTQAKIQPNSINKLTTEQWQGIVPEETYPFLAVNENTLTKRRFEYYILWVQISCFALLEGYLNNLIQIQTLAGLKTEAIS